MKVCWKVLKGRKINEVRESRIEIEIHQEKIDFINGPYKIRILEKSVFREYFNRKWGEEIDWIRTKESDFGSQSKESKVR